jgi:hypothetical protein
MGMTQYYVDTNGNYLGGFDGATPPVGAIEVSAPPTDGRQKWINNAWAALDPTILTTVDQNALNTALAEPGSVVRALGLVMFAEINKLRVKNGDPAYTMQQFLNALQAQMR